MIENVTLELKRARVNLAAEAFSEAHEDKKRQFGSYYSIGSVKKSGLSKWMSWCFGCIVQTEWINSALVYIYWKIG